QVQDGTCRVVRRVLWSAAGSARSWQAVLQLIVVLAEVSAVVAGADASHLVCRTDFRDGLQPDLHGLGNGFRCQAVNDDFQHCPVIRTQLRIGGSAQGWTEGVVG